MTKERYFAIICMMGNDTNELGGINEYLNEIEPYMESMRKEDKNEWYNDICNDLGLDKFNDEIEYDMNRDVQYDVWMYIYDESDC